MSNVNDKIVEGIEKWFSDITRGSLYIQDWEEIKKSAKEEKETK